MRKHWLTLLSLILLPSLFAGCAKTSSDGDDYALELGLGLVLPENLPAPAPLVDDAEGAVRLEQFLWTHGPEFFEECRTSEGAFENNTASYLEEDQVLQALFWLPSDCAQLSPDAKDALIDGAMAEGNEQEVFDRMHGMATRAIQNASARLSQVEPGSAIEAQIIALLAGNIEWNRAGVGTAAMYFSLYADGTARDRLQLTAGLGLHTSRESSNLIIRFIDRYPWQDGSCSHPAQDALTDAIRAKLAYTLELAAERTIDPTDAEFVTTKYGRLVQDYPYRLETYETNGWWPALMALDQKLTEEVAYWENYTASPVATREEAAFLLASYRNHTRTLWTDYSLYDYGERIEYLGGWPWEWDRDTGGLIAMILPAFKSPFLDLHCTAAS